MYMFSMAKNSAGTLTQCDNDKTQIFQEFELSEPLILIVNM